MRNQGRVDVEFWNEVRTLIHIITENRDRGASGPVHIYHQFRYININVLLNLSVDVGGTRQQLYDLRRRQDGHHQATRNRPRPVQPFKISRKSSQ